MDNYYHVTEAFPEMERIDTETEQYDDNEPGAEGLIGGLPEEATPKVNIYHIYGNTDKEYLKALVEKITSNQ